MKGKLNVKGLAFTVCAMAMPAAVCAEQPWLEVAPGMHKVPDEVLSSMHGRYVSATNQVVYFGVQMSSNWSAPNGTVLNAGSNFSINVSSPTPTFNYTSSTSVVPGEGDVSTADTTQRSIDGDGVQNISGVTQSIQTAGDGNDLENVVRVSVLHDIPDVPATDNSSGNAGSSMSYSDGKQQLTTSAGMDGDGMFVSVGVDGQGTAEQSIRGIMDVAGGKGLIQKITVLGDNQVVMNRMGLNVVMQKAADSYITQQNLGNAINTLRGVKPEM